MGRKRQRRNNYGLFDVPDRPHDDGDSAATSDSAGVFGGPAGDSGLLGDPGHTSGLFDAPERAPGEMPGLFDRPVRTASDSPGSAEKPARAAGGGLFERPPPRRK
jgi:hypothetical protein